MANHPKTEATRPTHYGFNFQWMFNWWSGPQPAEPNERALDFLAEFGFNFVRIPMDYRFWARDLAYFLPDRSIWKYICTKVEPYRVPRFLYRRALDSLATVGLFDIPTEERFWTRHFIYFRPDEITWGSIGRYLAACSARGLHLCLNLHRAPGYCINRNNLERYNLWLDKIAQDTFVSIWEQFAERYKGISNDDLSFDLVNEPPEIGQYDLTRENHAAVIRRTVAAIRAIDPTREIVIDGLAGGNLAMPELADLEVTHSGRGYQPQNVTHYQAPWWPDYKGQPFPCYPGTQFAGQKWDRDALVEFYQPWRDVEAQGVKIHIGEFGCYNKTPNDVALRWFADLLSVFKEFGWGYSLWEFEGPFGVVNHGRPGTIYENVKGYPADRALLDLLVGSR